MSTLKKQIHTKNIIKASIFLLFFFTIYYIFIVNSAALNAAEAERVNDKIGALKSEIGELELQYIEKNKEINEADVQEFGLNQKDKKDAKIFVQRDSNTRLTLNE